MLGSMSAFAGGKPENIARSEPYRSPQAAIREHSLTCLGLIPRPRDGSVVSSLHCTNDPQPEGHMASYIGRRKFLATLGGTAAWPLAARAQEPAIPVIGFLSLESPGQFTHLVAAFRRG